MGTDEKHPALRRILRDQGADELLDTLRDRLCGSDLTTVLLAVVAGRAAGVVPHDVLAQYERDRFVAPGEVDALAMAAADLAALRAVAPRFDPVVLSPVAPFGTHSAVAGVAQDNVVTTIRGTEVAADPTNSLALEAAVRRQALLAAEHRSAAVVRLAAVARVVRAQRFVGPRSFSHFSLLGLVSAGRDQGDRRFETDELAAHVVALAEVVRACVGPGTITPPRILVRLTDFGGRSADVLDSVAAAVHSPDVDCERWPEREAARGYYLDVCFKLSAVVDGEVVEVGDGGMVDWTQRLLGNRKERLMTSGLSLERLALVGGWGSAADSAAE